MGGSSVELWPEHTQAASYAQLNREVIRHILTTPGFQRKKLQSLYQNVQGFLSISERGEAFVPFESLYQEFLEFLDREGMTYIDLFPIIKTSDSKLDIRRLFNGHYTPYTNQIVSEGIIDYLEKNLEEDLKK